MNTRDIRNREMVTSALEAYERPLLRYAASITGDAELARDIVQEAFVALWREDPDALADRVRPWLYRVVRNRSLNHCRKEARMTPLAEASAAALPSREADPRARAVRNETRDLAAEALRRLPHQQQEACRLKFHDGFTYRQISEIMGISLGTVSHLITEALHAVRDDLRTRTDLTEEA